HGFVACQQSPAQRQVQAGAPKTKFSLVTESNNENQPTNPRSEARSGADYCGNNSTGGHDGLTLGCKPGAGCISSNRSRPEQSIHSVVRSQGQGHRAMLWRWPRGVCWGKRRGAVALRVPTARGEGHPRWLVADLNGGRRGGGSLPGGGGLRGPRRWGDGGIVLTGSGRWRRGHRPAGGGGAGGG